jgi:hypothetical protein
MLTHNYDFEEEEDASAIDFDNDNDDPAFALDFERGPCPVTSTSMDASMTIAIRELIDIGRASFPVALETAMDMAHQNQLMFLLRFNACETQRNVQVCERSLDEEDRFSFIAHPQAQSILDGDIATKSMQHWRQKLIGVHNIGSQSVMVCTNFLSGLHVWMGAFGAIMNREAHVSRGYSDKYTSAASATVANFMICNNGDVNLFLSPTSLLRSAGVDSTGACELAHAETTSRGTRLAKLCHLVLAYRVAKSLRCLPTGHSDAGLLRLKGGIGLLKQAHRQQSVTAHARAKRYAETKPWPELWAAQSGRVDIAFTDLLETVVKHGEDSACTRLAAWGYQLELLTTITTQNAAARPSDLSSLKIMDVTAIRDVSNDKLVSVTVSQWAGKGAKNKYLSGATPMSADVATGVCPPGTYKITDEKSVKHFAFWVGAAKLRMPHMLGWSEFLLHGDATDDAWVQRLTVGGLRGLLADNAVSDSGTIFLSCNGRQPLSRSSLSGQIKDRVGLSPRFIRRSQSTSVAAGVLEDGVQTGARFALQASLNHGNQTSLDHYGMAINTSEGLVMLAVLTRSLFCYTVILQNQQHQNETAFNAFRKGVQNHADGLGRASIQFSDVGSSSAGHAYASASADVLENPYDSRELQPEFCDPRASASSAGQVDESSTDHVYGSGFTKRARNQLRVHVQARHCDSCGSVFSDPKALSKHKAFSTRICTSRRELAGSGLAAQIEAGRVAALAERVEAAKQRSLPRAVQLTATWNSNGSVNL